MNRHAAIVRQLRIFLFLILSCGLAGALASCGGSGDGSKAADVVYHDQVEADSHSDTLLLSDLSDLPDLSDVQVDLDLGREEELGQADAQETTSHDVLEQRGVPDETEPLPINCGDGWTSCHSGVMNISATGHIAPWGDCEEDGFSWPCVSGTCGQYELCKDDYDALNLMLTEPTDWADGSLTIADDQVTSGDWPRCRWNSCSWTVKSAQGEPRLVLMVGPSGDSNSGPVKTTPVDGATNLVASEYPNTLVTKFELNGTPVEIQQLTLWWAPMPDPGFEGDAPGPGLGRAGAVEVLLADGGKTRAVWRLRADVGGGTTDVPVEYVVQQDADHQMASSEWKYRE